MRLNVKRLVQESTYQEYKEANAIMSEAVLYYDGTLAHMAGILYRAGFLNGRAVERKRSDVRHKLATSLPEATVEGSADHE